MPEYVVRPRIRYIASTAILCRSGKDLGETLTGHHDFQLADDVIHKVHVGHYTFYSVAVVKNPKLLQKAEGVFCRSYVDGEDANFIPVSIGTGGAFLPNNMLMDATARLMYNHVAPETRAGNVALAEQAFMQDLSTEITDPAYAAACAIGPDCGDRRFADTLFSSYEDLNDTQRRWGALIVKGTHVHASGVYINPLGLGPCTYNGAQMSRIGKGDPVDVDRCLSHLKSLHASINMRAGR